MTKKPDVSNSEFIYKIVTATHWLASQDLDHIPPMPVDIGDGYMHFSTANQLSKTLELYFSGETGVVILAIRTLQVDENLKWEPSRGGDLFPHLFAPLEKSAIAWHKIVDVNASGQCDLPPEIA